MDDTEAYRMSTESHPPTPAPRHVRGTLETYLLYPWRLLREPRLISAIHGAAYTVIAAMGWAGLTDPEDTLPQQWLVAWSGIAWLLLLGGTLGLVSMWHRLWWIERGGIYAIIAASIGRILVLGALVAEPGELIIRGGYITVLVLLFVVRLVRIHGAPVDPYREDVARR